MFANKIITIFQFLTIHYNIICATEDKRCDVNDPLACSCKFTDNSGVVDLRSLGNTNANPRFQDVIGSDGNTYSYNPCYGFKEGSCDNAAVCLSKGGQQLQIGDAGSKTTAFEYSADGNTVFVAYIRQTPTLTGAIVQLKCDPEACDPVFTVEGEKSPGFYSFNLRSVCSCPGLCTESGPTKCRKSEKIALSPGSIFLIGFAGCLSLYCMFGVIYMKIKRNASGTDLIPGKNAWIALPGLVFAGVRFFFGSCTPKRANYESI